MNSANRMPPPQDIEADPSCAGIQARRLLVIDDDVTHRMVIGSLARKLGYATSEASTVAEAFELISTQHFDCMTLDLHMGAHNGSELLDVINSKQSDIPVIVISSADDDERWEVLRVAALYGIRITELPKPLQVGGLRDVFMEIDDVR